MPIIDHKIINVQSSWAIWNINESMDDLFGLLPLNQNEALQFDEIHHINKKMEYLAGRLAVQWLVENAGFTYKGIHKDEFGKPHLLEIGVHMSLANSYPFAAAMINLNGPVGIDLEKPHSKLKRIAKKFLHYSELEFAMGDEDILCILWGAKEALYKLHGRKRLIFGQNLRIQPFEIDREGIIKGSIILDGVIEDHQIYYSNHNGYYLCYNI